MFILNYDFSKNFADEASVKMLCQKAATAVWQQPDLQPLFKNHQSLALTLKLSDDAEVKTLNKDFRGKDKTTNVLSFPSGDDMPGMEMLDLKEKYIGDMIVSVDVLKKEAQAQNKTIEDHFVHLFVHSLLHLLGYDHIEDDEAEIMERLEIDILSALGVNNPYHKVED